MLLIKYSQIISWSWCNEIYNVLKIFSKITRLQLFVSMAYLTEFPVSISRQLIAIIYNSEFLKMLFVDFQ